MKSNSNIRIEMSGLDNIIWTLTHIYVEYCSNLFCNYLSSKWSERKSRQFEMLFTIGYTNDGKGEY